ncbi:hypothetical protein [Nitrosospira sp. Nsp1]|uniref:hypothetical protein n=1 Tax=Nitrosospira sp. Nsp1 TaxID=136547 RepID=UPI0008887F0A|nr:hypothetical protein [Nitrosospira sp. Nsp1]SCX57623.1 hypothetical protein SAMN05720354_12011 [Nitrosospira sp. Nsp1]
MTTNNLSVSSLVQLDEVSSVSIKTRVNLAWHHLFAASRAVGHVRQIEKEYESVPYGPFWEEIFHRSLSIVTLTVASLEGLANELYFENSAIEPTLNPAAAEVVARVIDRESIITKFDLVLALRSGKRMPRDTGVVQNVEALVSLRNAVLHFRPEWSCQQDRHKKLSDKLLHKFQPSPFLPNESLFPRAWASGSFGVWALKATVNYLDYFYNEVNIRSPVKEYRVALSEYSGATI